jgi:hypothetical protein
LRQKLTRTKDEGVVPGTMRRKLIDAQGLNGDCQPKRLALFASDGLDACLVRLRHAAGYFLVRLVVRDDTRVGEHGRPVVPRADRWASPLIVEGPVMQLGRSR